MANCLGITKGRDLSCKNAVAGYKAAYFINYDPTIVWTVSGATSDITAISGLTTNESFKYELKATTNTVTVDMTTSRDNGTTFYTQTAVLNITGVDSDMITQMNYMAAGRPFIVIADNMGQYWLMGKEEGADLTSGQLTLGGAKGDFNGGILTFVAEERYPLYKLTGAAITSLLASVSPNI